jgi:uncharacterized membrane protein YfcA
MSFPRKIFDFLMMASVAHAKWDYEVSMSIIRNKKKLLILFILLLPILAITISDAAGILGGKKAYAPAFYSTTIFLVSIAVGLAAGLITGCIGAGGGFIITPALMAAGVKGILAVGTDLFHIFAKAIMGTAVHKKLGNVSVKLAIAFLAGAIIGAVVGGTINRALYNANPLLSEAFISAIYAILLGFLGVYALSDFIKATRGVKSGPPGGDAHGAHGGPAGVPPLGVKVQNIKIPPMITFDEDYGGRRISGVIIAGGGFIVGNLAAMMGVGGGFATFPMFVYIFGVSSMTTVGTDILQIIFTAGFAAISQYAIYGYVFYTLAMGMLLGSLIGIQVGALTTKVVKGIHIRGFYAMAILAGFVNRASALPSKLTELEVIKLSKSLTSTVEFVGNIIFWIVVGAFGVWVLSKFFMNIKTLRGEE